MRVMPHLTRHILRATPWLGFLPAGVIALGMAWVATRQPADTMARLLPTRIAVLAVVIAVAFVYDDPASSLTDPAPSPLRRRRLVRTVAAVIPAVVVVGAVLVVASTGMDLVRVIPVEDMSSVGMQDESLFAEREPVLAPFPGGRLALETATMIAFTLATAAVVGKRGETEPGRIATGVLLGLYAVTWMIPDPFKPWADPGDQRWDTGAAWWWVGFALFALAGVGLCWDARTKGAKGSFYLGSRLSILASWRSASRTTKQTGSPVSSPPPPGSR